VADLILHSRRVETIFDLLGHDENDMTAALGWCLARSPALMASFMAQVADGAVPTKPVVELQRHEAEDGGFTDVEVRSPEVHIVVEAKRGWALPSEAQMHRYDARFADFAAERQAFVVLNPLVDAVVRRRLATWSPPHPVQPVVLGWSRVVGLADRASRLGTREDRLFVQQLAAYIRGVADMRDTNTNSVHVVSLTRNVWEGWPSDLSPVDEVEKHRVYHYPTRGGNYPKIVPNYMGFRYDGKLQSIHHVDDYVVVDSPFGLIPGAPKLEWEEPAYLLRLGPPFGPNHEVRTGVGIFRAAPVTADLDLLTCQTVSEARDATKARQSAPAD